MKTLAEIFYDAICADAALMEAVGGHVISTCFEVPPGEMDNTPVPNIIITNDGFQAQIFTKDDIWDSDTDTVQATVDIAANSPEEVEQMIDMARKAVNNYIHTMYELGQSIPTLKSLNSDGVQWDWVKPCYYQKLYYTCDMAVDLDADNTEDNE
jgi:hypothetical protein